MSEPCVIARLGGGLGNQLFMYAFNKAMAERNRVPLKLDIVGGFERDRTYQRQHLLDHILPPEQTAGRWEARRFPLGQRLRKLERRINARRPLDRRRYVEEPDLRYHPEIRQLRITRPTVFNGYWQAPQYFDDLSPGIRERIVFPDELTTPIQAETDQIRTAEHPVCLAVRRYEEVPKPKHHILQLDYFQQAMTRIEQLVERPHFFVFAQDMAWARANLQSRHPITFASGKDPHTGVIQDLYLMTQCRSFILSNSSLHWWAAWLAASPPHMVIASQKGWPNEDMLPAHWLRLA